MAGALLGAWLLWRGGVAAVGLATDITGTGFGSFRASLAERVQATLAPEEFAVWTLLRERTPVDACILFVLPDQAPAWETWARLSALLSPRRLVPLAFAGTPPDRPPASADDAPRLHVLLFGALREHELKAPCELLARTGQAALWVSRPPTPR